MDEITFTKYQVTCETLGCGNGNIAIIIEAPSVDASFICGSCGQQILNYINTEEATENN
jgi:hypothetical protein